MTPEHELQLASDLPPVQSDNDASIGLPPTPIPLSMKENMDALDDELEEAEKQKKQKILKNIENLIE